MTLQQERGDFVTIILKTRRSHCAVHFHPCGTLVLLTAEVNDLDYSNSSMTSNISGLLALFSSCRIFGEYLFW